MNADMIDVRGIDKAELLAALHNNTVAIGLGRLRDIGRSISADEVRNELAADNGRIVWQGSVDYYHGRPIKVELMADFVSAYMYDRDAGVGKLAMIVNELRSKL